MERKSEINKKIEAMIDKHKKRILSCLEQDENEALAYDGIVDEECFYSEGSKKILFLLKDTNGKNDYPDGNGHVVEDLRKTAEATKEDENKDKTLKLIQTYRTVCMLAKIIEDADFRLEDCWNSEKGFSVDKMRGTLKHIAVVNVRKNVGTGSCTVKKIKDALRTYYDLIKNEIDYIKPEIVICGGIFEQIKDEYKNDAVIKNLPNGKRYFIYKNCIYLEYCHPGARGGYEKHFNFFKETYCQLLHDIENTKK